MISKFYFVVVALAVSLNLGNAFVPPKDAATTVEQIGLNYDASVSKMVVTFASFGTSETTAECWYGISPDNLTETVSATGQTYTLKDYTSPMLFKATLDGLESGNKVYYYTVGSEALGYSKVTPFKSHPGVGTEGVTFHVYGDIGQTNNSHHTLIELVENERWLEGPTGGIVSMGDLSYANGDEPRWDTFGQMRQVASAHIPTLTTAGNHEWFDDDLYAFTAYKARFDNPVAANTGKRELYYSFDAGLVHWVMVAGYCSEMHDTSTQPCLSDDSPQMDWLVNDLKSVDRSKTPWVLVAFHQPYMNSNKAHSMITEGRPMRAAIEDTLYEYKVDLVFSGHVHAYERTCQSYQYKCTEGAPYYITIGDGGNHEGLAEEWVEPQPEWSVFRQASYGFGELLVSNSTSMTWRWRQNNDLTPTYPDEVTFTKDQAQKSFKPVTGKPMFVAGERGEQAALFNEVRTKKYGGSAREV